MSKEHEHRAAPGPNTDAGAGAATTPATSTVDAEHQVLTSREVACLLRVSTATLRRWRALGRGPRAAWLSERTPRYLRTEVESWLEDRS